MDRTWTRTPSVWLASASLLLVLTGCAGGNRLRIDPSGEHLFIYDSPPTAAAPCPPGTVPAAAAPRPAAPVPAAAAPAVAAPVSPYSDAAVVLTPFRTVAPVGTQIAMLAGVRGGDNYWRTNRRLEWWLAPGSAGQFTAIGQNRFADYLVGDFTRPRLVTNTYAVGSTTRMAERAGAAEDSVAVARGQGWITVTSPVEGTSFVTVAAPSVVVPSERLKTATIHWIDAQFGLPTPAITPAGGKAALTTTVWRQTNRCPRPGWIVRYEVTGGPAAVFAPSATPAAEVLTNEAGQAIAEIVQRDPSPGTSQVRVQVFRPADSCDGPLLVREGCVLVTWTASSPAIHQPGPSNATNGGPVTIPAQGRDAPPAARPSLHLKVAPQTEAIAGSAVTFDIEVSNRGDGPATGLTIRNTYGEGLEHDQRSPMERPLKDLPPGQTQQVAVTFRITQPGKLCQRVEVLASGGAQAAQDVCVIARARPEVKPVAPSPPPLAAGALAVRVDNRNIVTAGKDQQFLVQVTNQSDSPDYDVAVSAVIPPGSQLVEFGTRGPNEKIKFEKLPGRVRFTPVAEMPARATLDYTIIVTTDRPGPIRLEAEARSRRQSQAVGSKEAIVLPRE